jgi:hypothetical protein
MERFISSSGNSVIDIHYIDNPDSGGMACNVMQHALHLPCYSARGNVNHPNYYLGRLQGSPCDTLQWTVIQKLNMISVFAFILIR